MVPEKITSVDESSVSRVAARLRSEHGTRGVDTWKCKRDSHRATEVQAMDLQCPPPARAAGGDLL